MKDNLRTRNLKDRYHGNERSESLEKTPFKSFNLTVQDYEGKKENLDKLFGELKSYLKAKDEFTKTKQKNRSVASDKRSTTGRENELSVPMLIKPQVTNMKEFNKRLDKDESKFDTKVAAFKSTKQHKKLMENVFQPIQCEETLSVGRNSYCQSGTGNFESKLFSKSDKTIHESLRMSKTKRRKSLPSFEEPRESSESLSNVENENSKSYNVSYYTSLSKGKHSDAGSNEYYSSSLNNDKSRRETEKPVVYPLKSVSDDYVYGANKSHKQDYKDYMKLPISLSTDSIRQDCEYYMGEIGKEMPTRISVTEPSSPAAPYTLKHSISTKILKMKNENTESDVSESESECAVPIMPKVRKSKSFVEQKASKKNYDFSFNSNLMPLQSKNSKGSKVKLRKLSRSSTSSCDSFCPSQSLMRNEKLKINKAEIENRRPYRKYETNSLRNVSKKKRGCGCEENPMDQHNDKGRYREGHQERKPPERVRSVTREGKTRNLPSSSRINDEMYLHLLDVLTQKNQGESKELQRDIFTKSLPRNHHKSKHPERHARDETHQFPTTLQCEKNCLKIVKFLPEGGSPVNKSGSFTPKKKTTDQHQKSKDRRFIQAALESSSGRNVALSLGRCGCSPYACYNTFCTQQRGKEYSPRTECKGEGVRVENPGRFRRNDEECVLRIEDEKLWIKICKAVEEVNLKEKNLRKSD